MMLNLSILTWQHNAKLMTLKISKQKVNNLNHGDQEKLAIFLVYFKASACAGTLNSDFAINFYDAVCTSCCNLTKYGLLNESL